MRFYVRGGLYLGFVAALGACALEDEPTLGDDSAEIVGGVDTPPGTFSRSGTSAAAPRRWSRPTSR